MPNPEDYAVGWICAVGTEYVAAQEFLDEEHDQPEFVSTNDTNDYALGRIGKHNVVIAVLPDGEYGTSSAASVATNMLHSFPNVRIGVLVGIGGGAPSPKHDIRLGDVVVSAPRDGQGGVFQYDFGKTIQNQAFHNTRFLNQPPTALRTALTGIQAQYKRKGHQLEAAVDTILDKNPRLLQEYKRPAPDTDRLFRAEVACDSRGCAAFCAAEPLNMVSRRKRRTDEDNPAIHYGLIASANQVMKDATVRDKLAAEKDVLCFEMEAAGLMNHFPCLVIRGICDYSDSHKNKDWQGYAAMAASAYAKDLLSRIAPNRVEAEKKIGDILSGLQEVAEDHRDIAEDHRNIAKENRDVAIEHFQFQKDQAKERLTEEEQKCHQLFRLTKGDRDATYEWYKDRVEDRVEGTCEWFLRHEHFRSWLKQGSGPLLVTADPGCGKSVLAKYLIDHSLPQSANICYFFFKDQDQNTVRQALCALLHQLFSLKPSLIKHAMQLYKRNGPNVIHSTDALWNILQNATKDPQAGPVIIVLDALDECTESDLAALIQNVHGQFRSDQFGLGKLKYLLTCRPYQQILTEFHGLLDAFPNIRIPGEEKSDTISQEVNRVITHRVGHLGRKKRLSSIIKRHLEKRLHETTHRTYLWVYLVFDYLEKEDLKKTTRGIDAVIAALPQSINETYEKILDKSKDHMMVQKALSIILVASRPLTLSEMNVAMNVEETSQSIRDLDLEDEEDFKIRLRSLCGLFVSIHQGKIYFLHQTARDFLLEDSATTITAPSELHWHHSIRVNQAHAVIAKLCVVYLKLFNSDDSSPRGAILEASDPDSASVDDASVNSLNVDDGSVDSVSSDIHTFFDYSAKNWGYHFREADIIDEDDIIPSALIICDPDSKSYSAWSAIYWNTKNMRGSGCTTDLMLASHFGHIAVVKHLLQNGAEVEAKAESMTPLTNAINEQHVKVVELLLKNGVMVEYHYKAVSEANLLGLDMIADMVVVGWFSL